MTDILTEGMHIAHPEDVIYLEGVNGVREVLKSLENLSIGKEKITIKFDGYPALVFGRNVDGKLVICDKHMFAKSNGRVTSPDMFRQYDIERGADRTDLYHKIDIIWSEMQNVIPLGFRGYYMGDLLFAGLQTPINGEYSFTPNAVTYHVKEDSPNGKKIRNSVAGIAVHTFISDIGEPDQALNGLGSLKSNGRIWFVTGEIKSPIININQSMIDSINTMLDNYEDIIGGFISDTKSMGLTSVLNSISPYITSKIKTGSLNDMMAGFLNFLPTRLDGETLQSALQWLNNDKEGISGIKSIFAIWVALYNLKLNIKKQIDVAVVDMDVKATIGNISEHEGYVIGSGDKKLKLVDRLTFTKANFNKNNFDFIKKELVEARLFKTESSLKGKDAKDIARLLYASVLSLEILYQENDKQAYNYALKTIAFGDFSHMRSACTDLGNMIAILTNQNEYAHLLGKRVSLYAPEISLRVWLRKFLYGSSEPSYLRSFLLKLEENLMITGFELRQCRRIVGDWDKSSLNEKHTAYANLRRVFQNGGNQLDIWDLLKTYYRY